MLIWKVIAANPGIDRAGIWERVENGIPEGYALRRYSKRRGESVRALDSARTLSLARNWILTKALADMKYLGTITATGDGPTRQFNISRQPCYRGNPDAVDETGTKATEHMAVADALRALDGLIARCDPDRPKAMPKVALAELPALILLRDTLRAKDNVTELAEVADLGIERLVRIEERISGAEDTGLRARWEFGRELLAARDGKGRLPNGYLKQVTERTGVGRVEMQRRTRFAERFPTDDELCHAVTQFRSWHEVVNVALAQPADDPQAPTADPVTPEGQFSTIVADPPWRYGNTSTRGAAEDHYRTMSIIISNGTRSQESDTLMRMRTEANSEAGRALAAARWSPEARLQAAVDTVVSRSADLDQVQRAAIEAAITTTEAPDE